jgi:hypothetical protein
MLVLELMHSSTLLHCLEEVGDVDPDIFEFLGVIIVNSRTVQPVFSLTESSITYDMV